MKRVLILSLCAVLCGASPALASQLAGTLTDVQGDTVTVNYAVTSNVVPGIDQVDFTIGSISGGAAYIDTLAGGGTYGSGGGGLFTPSAGGYIGLSTSTSLWPSFADSNIGYAPTGFPVPGSWINLDTYQTSGSRGGSGFALTGVTSTGLYGIKGYTSFAGVWASTVSDNSDGGSPPTYYPQFPTIGAELACIYVTTGTTVTYNGLLGLDNLHSVGGTFASSSVVPEPSMLALLASGLIGLTAYAWRKRGTKK